MRIEMGYNDSLREGSICFEQLSPDEFDNLRQILKSIFEFTQFQNCKQLAHELDVRQLRIQLTDKPVCAENKCCDLK